jgi:3-oxoacyl-[acyl-carrier-protein] synthase II
MNLANAGILRMAIRGIGVVGGFGCGTEALSGALRAGRTEPTPVSIPTVRETVDTEGFFADTAPLAELVSKRALRRLPHHTRMGILAGMLALKDAGLEPPLDERTAIVVATGYGSTCNTFDFQGLTTEDDIRQFSPIQFSNSVHNAAGAHMAVIYGAHGPNISINQLDLSVPAALRTAGIWLAERRADRVLVGGVDEFSRVMAYHRHRLIAEGTANPVPVGEGAAFFLLTAEGTETPRYGFLRDPWCGAGNAAPPVPEGAVAIRNAAGFREAEETGGEPVSGAGTGGEINLTGLYGHLPVGMGFDIAAAAIRRRAGRIPGGNGSESGEGSEIVGTPGTTPPVVCVRNGAAGGWGRVVVEGQ